MPSTFRASVAHLACIALLTSTVSVAAVVAAAPAQAHHESWHPETVQVNAAHDAVDADPADGVCDTGEGAEPVCTLRAAVQHAHVSAFAGVNIFLESETYELSSDLGSLEVTHPRPSAYDGFWPLQISGAEEAVIRAPAGFGERLLDIASDPNEDGQVDVFLDGVELRGGESSDGGGAVRVDGGYLSLSNVRVVDNHAHHGGGIAIERGSFRIDGSTFTGNTADEDGGGLWIGERPNDRDDADIDDTLFVANAASGDGGGVYAIATEERTRARLRVEDVVLRGNEAARGGGIWLGVENGAELRVGMEDTLIVENRAVADPDEFDQPDNGDLDWRDLSSGGGAGAWLGSGVELDGRNVLVTGNIAGGNGGGLAIHDAEVDLGWAAIVDNEAVLGGGAFVRNEDHPVALTNVTLSGNRADRGGAALNGSSEEDVELTHVTVTNHEGHGAIDWDGPGDIVLRNSILAGNEGDCSGSLESEGGNLIPCGDTELGDVYPEDEDGNVVLGLADLAHQGGFHSWSSSVGEPDEGDMSSGEYLYADGTGRPVLVHALGPDSPAVDLGLPEHCVVSDQRMVRRSDGSCDAGAFELTTGLAQPHISGANYGEVLAGESFTHVFEVQNMGPDTAEEVAVEVALDEALTFVSADSGCDHTDGVVTCTLEDLAPAAYEWDETLDADQAWMRGRSLDWVWPHPDPREVSITVQTPAEARTLSAEARVVSVLSHDPNPTDEDRVRTSSVLVYEDVVDPPPTERPDADGDGVHDIIDIQDDTTPTQPPDWWPQLHAAFQHDETSGRILDAGGHEVFVQPDPSGSPTLGRVLATIDTAPESSTDPAQMAACGFVLRLNPTSAVVVRCGSLYVEVLEGGAEVELPNGATVTVPDGVSAFIEEQEDGSYVIEHLSGDGSITIHKGEQEHVVSPGESLNVPLDVTPPVVSAEVIGTSGLAGWHTGDVVVTWSVSDAESHVTQLTGCDPASVVTDNEGVEFTCEAVSEGGTTSESVLIKRDATPPVVQITGVTDGGSYSADAVPVAGCATLDVTSGVASHATVTVSGSGPGQHTATCAGATDQAGNSAQAVSVAYTVTTAGPPAWVQGKVYNTSDRVTYGGKVYQASWWTTETPGQSPWGSWQEIATDADGKAIWTSSRIFDTGDVVTHNGKTYKAKWWTRNQVPGDPRGPWEEQGSKAGGHLTWTASQVYNTGDVVSYNGTLFRAKWWTRNQAPGDPWGPWEAHSL